VRNFCRSSALFRSRFSASRFEAAMARRFSRICASWANPGGRSDFAARYGYDLKDYVNGGWVSDWWGFAWMILAEARGVLTPDNRSAAWSHFAT
jgi:hypothetical protein